MTRAKRGMDARRVYSTKTDRTTGVICDQLIRLNGFYVARDYPEHLRRIRFKDPDTGKTLVFLTNNTAAHQAFFGHERERGEDANLVRRVHLRAYRNHQKGASTQCLSLHNVTDIVGLDFREKPYFMRPAA